MAEEVAQRKFWRRAKGWGMWGGHKVLTLQWKKGKGFLGRWGAWWETKKILNRLGPSQGSGMRTGGAREKMEFHKQINISCVLPDGRPQGTEGLIGKAWRVSRQDVYHGRSAGKSSEQELQAETGRNSLPVYIHSITASLSQAYSPWVPSLPHSLRCSPWVIGGLHTAWPLCAFLWSPPLLPLLKIPTAPGAQTSCSVSKPSRPEWPCFCLIGNHGEHSRN